MLTYKGKYVKAQKVPIKESMPDLLHIQKDSYKKYIKEIVFKDFKYFEDVLNKSLKLYSVKLEEITIDEESGSHNDFEVKRIGSRYYPVNVIFSVDNCTSEKVTALKIPYMDSQCILSIGASERILLNSLTIAQDITLEKNKLQVMGKDNKTFNLVISDSGKIYYKNNNNYKLEITNLAVSVASELGIIDQHSGKSGYTFLKDTFYNKIMVEALNSEKWENRLTLAAVEKKNKIINEWSNYTNINVEKCRESLNMCLSLEKCIDQIVGKNIYNKEGILIAQKGELISNFLLKTLLKNEVFEITIKYKPNIAGYILKEKIQFNKISKGIKVTNFLKGLDTSLNGCGYVYKDIQTNICFKENTLITPDILDFLYEMGLDSLLASKAKSSTVTEPIRFYHEVIGNRMVRIESLDIKNNIYNSNDWIYYPTYKQLGIAAFNEANREKLQPKNLTGYDILAL